jgi:tRNA(Ile)-lysidine synthase
MATYLVAVSGGVDSVVLLDLMSKSGHHIITAHVDHGIRPDSAADARFVAALAKRYQIPFVSTRFELGPKASEEQARLARYEFLFAEAAKHKAEVVTAHHQDDMVETIAINFSRGTGWRGLAVLNRAGIYRPLLGLTKAKLYAYALAHHLEWVEDSTNHTDAYHRNRLRRAIHRQLPYESQQKLAELRSRQLQLARDIERESAQFTAKHSGSRHFLTLADPEVACEILGAVIKDIAGTRPPRPQIQRALLAVKTAKPGTIYDVGDGVKIQFTSRNYQLLVV